MPDALAQAIVREALALQKAQPELPALRVLDLAMRGRRGTAPDFGTSPGATLLDPYGPFGNLLAAAFDAQITFSGVRQLGASPEARRATAFEEFWVARVRKAFVTRYHLHEPPPPAD